MLQQHSDLLNSTNEPADSRCPVLLDAIVKVQSMVIEQRPASAIFAELLDVLLKVTESEFGFIGEILTDDSGERYLKTHAISNMAWNEETRNILDREQASGLVFGNLQTLFGRVITTGEPLITNDPSAHPASGGTPEGHPELRAFMGLPFHQSETLMGMVGVANSPGGYTDSTAVALAPLLNACGYVIGSRRQEQLRQQSEARLQTLSAIVQSSSDAIISTDRDGKILSWNTGAEKLFGYLEADALGQDLTLIVPAQERGVFFELFEQVLQGEILETLETTRLNRSNDLIDVSWTFSPTFDHSGLVNGTSSILRNISKRKKNQKKLQEANAFKASVLHAATEVALVVCDLNGQVRFFNRGAEKLFGCTTDEVVGQRSLTDFHTAEELQRRGMELAEELQHPIEGLDVLTVIPSIREVETREWELVRENGTTFPAEVAVSLVQDRQGKTQGYLAVTFDLTRVKKTEKQLRNYNHELEQSSLANVEANQRLKMMVAELELARQQAERAAVTRSRFLANMSHEIRTPINGIMGMTELALTQTRDRELVEHLNTVKQCSEHLLSLINDILDISKIEAGKMVLAPEAFSSVELLNEIAKATAPVAKKKGLPLLCRMDPEVPQGVVGDISRLRQILLNLVSNAIKFTHHGEVRVEINCISQTETHCSLMYRVSDEGIGIPADKQKVIFDSFAQADASTTRDFGGTGLGLAISSELVALMSSVLTVESEVGRGSVFSFTISHPIADSVSTPAGQNPSFVESDNVPEQDRLQVLLAEDNQVNRRFASRVLEKRGHEVTPAVNGQEALDCLKVQQFDLVLMDIQMPVLDGMEAILRIREQEQTTKKHLPIIALTAHAMPEDRERYLNAGADGYLSKPFKPNDLLELIDTTLHATRQQEMSETCEQNAEDLRQIFDKDALLKRVGGDETLLLELLDLYFEQRPALLETLDHGLESESTVQIFQAAHKIKGSVGMLCAEKTRVLAFQLEECGREGDLEQCQTLALELKQELQNLELRFGEISPQL